MDQVIAWHLEGLNITRLGKKVHVHGRDPIVTRSSNAGSHEDFGARLRQTWRVQNLVCLWQLVCRGNSPAYYSIFVRVSCSSLAVVRSSPGKVGKRVNVGQVRSHCGHSSHSRQATLDFGTSSIPLLFFAHPPPPSLLVDRPFVSLTFPPPPSLCDQHAHTQVDALSVTKPTTTTTEL